MMRWAATLFTFAVPLTTGWAGLGSRPPFPVVETGIPEMRPALADGRVTCRRIVGGSSSGLGTAGVGTLT
jgi:hypothetical protein